jgi:transposase
LVPRQNSTGGKHRLGGITKQGNRYLRRLLINGASANLLRSNQSRSVGGFAGAALGRVMASRKRMLGTVFACLVNIVRGLCRLARSRRADP